MSPTLSFSPSIVLRRNARRRRTLSRRPRKEVEALLREMAFALHLARSVKQTITAAHE
jgi:hypothetical protein